MYYIARQGAFDTLCLRVYIGLTIVCLTTDAEVKLLQENKHALGV